MASIPQQDGSSETKMSHFSVWSKLCKFHKSGLAAVSQGMLDNSHSVFFLDFHWKTLPRLNEKVIENHLGKAIQSNLAISNRGNSKSLPF